MQLNSRETTLLDAFRRLPGDAAHEAFGASAAPDSWSEEDLREFTAQSLKRGS